MNAICELCHSLDSESAAARLTIPALVEVNLSGEETKSGVTPEDLPAFLGLYPDVRGLMTMPPFATDPEASRPYFKRLRALAEEHGLSELSMGTSQDYRVAVEEGATYVRIGSTLLQESPTTAVTFRATMSFADVWNKTLVYFGIAEEEEWDEDGYLTDEDLQRAYAERPNVRRLAPRRRREEFDDWTDPEPSAARTSVAPAGARAPAPPRRREHAEPRHVKVHLVLPRSFNDAQQIADRFKEGVPVILNLQGSDQELSKRLIDFGSGLTYALDGGMQRVADKVFLLTPRNVEVSAEERARMLERGGFFNQA